MQEQYPQKEGIDAVLRKAFLYWSNTLLYQVVFSFIYFTIFFSVFYYFAVEFGIWQQYLSAAEKSREGIDVYQKEIMAIIENPNYMRFYYIVLGTLVFLYPLNLGFYKIYRKMDLKEQPTLNDLFSGYNGANFFKFAGYYLFWVIIFSYFVPTIFLGILWVLVTLFTGPLMFFRNLRIFETFSLNVKVIRANFILIFVGLLVVFMFKGITLLTLFLFPFTYPFSNAMIYVLYQKLFPEKE